MRSRAALGVAGVAVAWGAIGVIVRQVPLPAVAIVACRCWFGAATTAVLLAARRRRHRGAEPFVRLPRPAVLAGLGVLLAVHWLFLVAAQQRAPIGTVLLLTYLAPVLVAVLAPPLLGEHVPGAVYVALAVALAGTAVLARPGSAATVGVVLALLAGVTYAGLTLASKWVLPGIGGLGLAFVQLLVAGAVLVVPAALAEWGPPQASWWWLPVLGVVFTGLLSAAYLTLLDRLPAASVGVLAYVEPASAVVMAWVFLGEVPTTAMVAGGLLVVLAGMLVVRSTTGSPGRHDGVPKEARTRVPR